MSMIYRQGDVLLIHIARLRTTRGMKEVPRDDKERIVLAYGEVTGHAHAIVSPHCSLYLDEQRPISEADAATMIARLGGGLIPDRVLSVSEIVDLCHDEHDTIKIPAGQYTVRIQREYSPLELRNVAD